MIKCIGCKKDMEQKHPNHKKCDDCRKQKRVNDQSERYASRKRMSHVKYDNQCLSCGEKFVALKITTQICSNKCRNKINNMRRQVKTWENKIILLQINIDEYKQMLNGVDMEND